MGLWKRAVVWASYLIAFWFMYSLVSLWSNGWVTNGFSDTKTGLVTAGVAVGGLLLLFAVLLGALYAVIRVIRLALR
jgi:hypothetical protein